VEDHQWSETSYGLTGPIVMMQNLIARLAAVDPTAARIEITRWPTDDQHVFARLRIWAASQTVLSPREAAEILLGLPDAVFWGSLHERDLLYALRDRWSDFSDEEQTAIEDRLRRGAYPWADDLPGGPSRAAAYDRMNRLHWLNSSGVRFNFDVAAEIDALRALAPEWTEESGDHAADSHTSEVYTVDTDPDPEPLLATPIAEILTQAQEAGQMRFLDRIRHEPFRGLAGRRPVRALAALTDSRRRGEFHSWAWSDFLRAEGRTEDPLRLVGAITARLTRLPPADLREIANSVGDWMKRMEARFYGDAAGLLPRLWDSLIKALNSAEPQRRRRPDVGWANAALNGPIGPLFEFLCKDPAKDGQEMGEGFRPHWLARLDQLLNLRGELRYHALVLISFQLRWLYVVDLSASSFQQPNRIKPTVTLSGRALCGTRMHLHRTREPREVFGRASFSKDQSAAARAGLASGHEQ
jgi:hypothetical protein